MVTEKEQGNTDEIEASGDEIDLRQENEALTRELKSRDAMIVRLEQTKIPIRWSILTSSFKVNSFDLKI